MAYQKIGAALAATMLLAGCGGNFESIFRTSKSEKFDVSFIDAKQRGLMVTQVDDEVRACAEPSPDVLASVAASFAASASVPQKVAAEFASSVTGSAASIGLRTQSIQLMRDALYRVCEAYAAGAIDGFQMRTLQIRYQNMIVGLLAIEQLTGAVRGPTATTGGTAAGGTAGDAVAISKQLEALAARRTTLNGELESREKAVATAEDERKKAADAVKAAGQNPSKDLTDKLAETEKELATAKTESAATKTELSDNATQREALIAALERSKTASASTTSTATSVLPAKPLDDKTAAEVGEVIRLIVRDVITQDNTLEGCIEFVAATFAGVSVPGTVTQKVLDYCEKRLDADIKLQEKRIEYDAARLQKMNKAAG